MSKKYTFYTISGFPDPENSKIRDPGISRSRKIPGNPDPDPDFSKPNGDI